MSGIKIANKLGFIKPLAQLKKLSDFVAIYTKENILLKMIGILKPLYQLQFTLKMFFRSLENNMVNYLGSTWAI